jgi:hypothetical protein
MLKCVFFPVNVSLRWLNNVTGVYLVQVSLLLIGQQGWGHFFEYRAIGLRGLAAWTRTDFIFWGWTLHIRGSL